eukprot:8267879-Pyramimonas_sp.AAC.1
MEMFNHITSRPAKPYPVVVTRRRGRGAPGPSCSSWVFAPRPPALRGRAFFFVEGVIVRPVAHPPPGAGLVRRYSERD